MRLIKFQPKDLSFTFIKLKFFFGFTPLLELSVCFGGQRLIPIKARARGSANCSSETILIAVVVVVAEILRLDVSVKAL